MNRTKLVRLAYREIRRALGKSVSPRVALELANFMLLQHEEEERETNEFCEYESESPEALDEAINGLSFFNDLNRDLIDEAFPKEGCIQNHRYRSSLEAFEERLAALGA